MEDGSAPADSALFEEEPPPGASPAGREHERLDRALEALIFAADEPVPPARLAEVFADVTGSPAPAAEAVEHAVERINAEYEAEGRPFRVEEWGGGFQMATHEEWAPFVKTLLAGPRQQSLSRSLSETLAVVAYRQPVTRPEVDFIRGVSADYALRKLMELELVDVKGRSDSLGRPLLYGTTAHFLEEFGLAALDDLPTLREVEDLLDDPNFNRERAKLLQLRREEESVAETEDGGAPENRDETVAEAPEGSSEDGSSEDGSSEDGSSEDGSSEDDAEPAAELPADDARAET